MLAEISAPDADDQLAQADLLLAQSNLQVTEATLALAKITLERDLAAGVGTAQGTLDRDLAKTSPGQVVGLRPGRGLGRAQGRGHRRLLDFAKIEAGKMELDPAPFSLRAAVGDTLRALTMRAQTKSLQLICQVAPDVPDALVGAVTRSNSSASAASRATRGRASSSCPWVARSSSSEARLPATVEN